MSMRGFLRSDGRKGIRNTVVVAYLVECAHHVAREIALPFRDRDVHVIGFPGCYPNSYAETMMERLCHWRMACLCASPQWGVPSGRRSVV